MTTLAEIKARLASIEDHSVHAQCYEDVRVLVDALYAAALVLSTHGVYSKKTPTEMMDMFLALSK